VEVRLNEIEMYGLLGAMGLEACPAFFLPKGHTVEEADQWATQTLELAGSNQKVLLKVVGREILHKTDI
jgi:hypothetical protein